MKTIADLLALRGATDPRDRELLLAHVLRKPREWVIAHPKASVRPATVARYCRLLARLERGEPLPYLIGEHWFYGRPFTVSRSVLIPRPETELLVDLTIDRIRKYRIPNTEYRILDIGTGSGCIAITLAAELPNTCVIAIDASPTALRVARANAQRHNISNRISFLQGNLLEPIEGHPRGGLPASNDSAEAWAPLPKAQSEEPLVPSQRNQRRGIPHASEVQRSTPGATSERLAPDLSGWPGTIVIANLPYLTTAEWRALPRSIRDYEPRQALDGGPDGLKYFRMLFRQLQLFTIYHSPFTILEVDPRRKPALTALIRKTLPAWRASWHRDLAGRWRVLEVVSC